MDLSFWRSNNYGSVFWRSSDYRTWKNDHGEEFLLVSSKDARGPAKLRRRRNNRGTAVHQAQQRRPRLGARQGQPPRPTYFFYVQVQPRVNKGEGKRWGEVKQNGPAASTKMNTYKFMKLEVCKCGESGVCGPINNVTSKSILTCHMLLDHFSHKHKWCSSKVTYNKTFWIHIQATSTVLDAKDRPLLVLSHFVASIGALLDPSLNAGCHCRRHQAILRLRWDVNASAVNIGLK